MSVVVGAVSASRVEVPFVAAEPASCLERALDEDHEDGGREKEREGGRQARDPDADAIGVYQPATAQTSPRSRAASAAAALRQSAPSTRKA